MHSVRVFFVLLGCAALFGCGVMEDNGVHMAYCLKDGAQKLARSSETELVVRFEPLDGTNQIYDVEFVPNSVVLIGGRKGGTSTYHLNYVRVEKRFDLMKTNSATFVTLRKVGDRIDVVDVR